MTFCRYYRSILVTTKGVALNIVEKNSVLWLYVGLICTTLLLLSYTKISQSDVTNICVNPDDIVDPGNYSDWTYCAVTGQITASDVSITDTGIVTIAASSVVLQPVFNIELGGTLTIQPHGTDVISCQAALPPVASGLCAYQPGDSSLLLQGDLLMPDTVLLNGDVLIGSDGRIACVGCDCASNPNYASARLLSCPGATISPGLINAHDHITYSDAAPVDHGTERYEHRHDWRRGIRGHTKISTSASPAGRELWAEVRAIVSGTTSISGSGSGENMARNLDRTAGLDGITSDAWDYTTFPLGDSSGTMDDSSCLNYNIDTPTPGKPYQPHVAEGIDEFAHNEFVCMSDENADLTGSADIVPDAALVHAIALNTADIVEVAAKNTSIIWSPRSDVSLYGLTAPVTAAQRLGVNIALSTSWLPMGSLNLFRELQCAQDLNTTYYDGQFTDKDLFRMVTINPARAAKMDTDIGSLLDGRLADITIFESGAGQGYAVVTNANEENVALVLKGGIPMHGNVPIMDVLGAIAPACEAINLCGKEQRICLEREAPGNTYAALDAIFEYPLVSCASPPPNERTCIPSRVSPNTAPNFNGMPIADDADGDGIADALDNCPLVFNPPLPIGDAAQEDTDGDNEGDACDICPLDSYTTICTVP